MHNNSLWRNFLQQSDNNKQQHLLITMCDDEYLYRNAWLTCRYMSNNDIFWQNKTHKDRVIHERHTSRSSPYMSTKHRVRRHTWAPYTVYTVIHERHASCTSSYTSTEHSVLRLWRPDQYTERSYKCIYIVCPLLSSWVHKRIKDRYDMRRHGWHLLTQLYRSPSQFSSITIAQ